MRGHLGIKQSRTSKKTLALSIPVLLLQPVRSHLAGGALSVLSHLGVKQSLAPHPPVLMVAQGGTRLGGAAGGAGRTGGALPHAPAGAFRTSH